MAYANLPDDNWTPPPTWQPEPEVTVPAQIIAPMSRWAFTKDRWPWVRAIAILSLVVLAVLVWNPRFTIAGIWNPWERGGYKQDRNAISLLLIGVTALGCLQSLRPRCGPTAHHSQRRCVVETSSDPAKIVHLRQNLRLKMMYDEGKIDRAIDLERDRLPNGNLLQWMEAAIQRWERDNR
jgi:hypothetical protein